MIILILLTFTSGLFAFSDEREAILGCVDRFYHSKRTGDLQLMRAVLHDSWQMKYLERQAKVNIVARDTYVNYFKNGGMSVSSYQITILDTSRNGEIAQVKVVYGNCDEYLTLFKIEGKWRIVDKVYTE